MVIKKIEETYKNLCIYLGLISITTGLFLISPNITGNAIGNIPKESSNLIGGVFLIIGFILGFFAKRVILLIGILFVIFNNKNK